LAITGSIPISWESNSVRRRIFGKRPRLPHNVTKISLKKVSVSTCITTCPVIARFYFRRQTKETDENNKSNSVTDNYYSEVPDAPARPLCVLISFAVKQSLQGGSDHLTLDGVTI
jgi:hypothetical protein